MKKLLLPSLGIILSFVFFVLSEKSIHAATLYWVGNDGANASVASNWKTTNPASCGSGDASAIPGSADDVNFDADCDNGAVIDSSFSSTVSTVTLSSGYAGTVTLSNPLTVSSTFTVSGGIWDSTSQALSVGGIFTLNNAAGTFKASSGTTTFNAAFSISAGTFTHNSGTVDFAGSGNVSCNGASFNAVNFAGQTGTRTIGNVTTCTLPLGSNPTIPTSLTLSSVSAVTLTGSGTMTFSAGTFTLSHASDSLSGFSGLAVTALTLSSGGPTLNLSSYSTFVAAGTVTLSVGSLTLPNGADLNGALTISAGTFNAPSGTMTLAGNLTVSGGTPTFNANGGTITFDGSGSGTIGCTKSDASVISFASVTFANTASSRTVSSGCNLPLGSNPTVGNGGSISLSGTLSGSGLFTMPSGGSSNALALNSGAVLFGFSGLNVSILNSSGATVDFSSYSPFAISAGLTTINSGTITFPSNAVVRGLTILGGTVNAPSGTMNVGGGGFVHTAGTFNHNNGTIYLTNTNGGSITGSTTFYNLTFVTASTGNRLWQFGAGKTQTVLGTLTLPGPTNKTSLRSSTPGLQYYFDVTGGRVLNNLDVQDANGIGNIYICSSCTDSGNNTNWSFINGSSIQFSLNYPNGDSHITNTNPTYRWSKASVSNNSAVTKYELYIQPKDAQNNNIGTALYIDNIAPFVGDNKQYQYNPTYTLYDDGDYLNITPNNYVLNIRKYNYRVVAHDSAGNIAENSYNFWVDAATANIKTTLPVLITITKHTNTELNVSKIDNNTLDPQEETPTPPSVSNHETKPYNNITIPWVVLLLAGAGLIWIPKLLKRKLP